MNVLRTSIKLPLVLGIIFAVGACSSQPMVPPSATVTEIEPASRPAKEPGCYMPVLYAEPTVDYRKIAIVDGWGTLNDSESTVLEVVKRKACETGADALLILNSATQNTRKLLMQGEPNPARFSHSADVQPGEYVADREKVPEVGSIGHPGTYVDAVAIVYRDPKDKP